MYSAALKLTVSMWGGGGGVFRIGLNGNPLIPVFTDWGPLQ